MLLQIARPNPPAPVLTIAGHVRLKFMNRCGWLSAGMPHAGVHDREDGIAGLRFQSTRNTPPVVVANRRTHAEDW